MQVHLNIFDVQCTFVHWFTAINNLFIFLCVSSFFYPSREMESFCSVSMKPMVWCKGSRINLSSLFRAFEWKYVIWSVRWFLVNGAVYSDEFFFHPIYSELLWAWSFFMNIFYGFEQAMMTQRKGDENEKREKNRIKSTRQRINDSFIHSTARTHAYACVFIHFNWVPLPSFWYRVLTSFFTW